MLIGVEVALLDPFKVPVKTLPVFSIAGEQLSETITLNNRVFGMPLREDILHRVVVWQVGSPTVDCVHFLVGEETSGNTLRENAVRSEVSVNKGYDL